MCCAGHRQLIRVKLMMLEMISISTNQSSLASVENYFSLMDGITTEEYISTKSSHQ